MFLNPSQGVVVIQTDNDANAEIAIADAVGKMLLHTSINSAATINVSEWTGGLYHVKVDGVTRKLLVQ